MNSTSVASPESPTLSAAQRLTRDMPDLDWVTDPLRVARLSQDFSWFSPVLKRQLAGKRADVVVRPRSEDEVRAVVGACARDSIPITVRGSGTGNYGQSTPLHGGVVLDLSGYNGFCWLRDGVGRAMAGIRLTDFDAQARPLGHELRWLPSTFRSATLGGLFGGGLMGLAGELQGLGLGLGDMQALGGEILDHGRSVAGEDAMAAIAQATGLDRYM